MRRFTAAIGVAAGATMMGLGVSNAAFAAEGRLTVNGNTYDNPSGCYDAPYLPMAVDNRTNEPVLMFDAPGCTGNIVGLVPPGQWIVSEFGVSVLVR